MIVNHLTIGNHIAFTYARSTKSGISSRAGIVHQINPQTIVIEERLDPNTTQFRQFYKSAMLNVELHTNS